MLLLNALSYTPYAPIARLAVPSSLAVQYHARHGAAPPEHQFYHAGPCSWRYALATPVL